MASIAMSVVSLAINLTRVVIVSLPKKHKTHVCPGPVYVSLSPSSSHEFTLAIWLDLVRRDILTHAPPHPYISRIACVKLRSGHSPDILLITLRHPICSCESHVIVQRPNQPSDSPLYDDEWQEQEDTSPNASWDWMTMCGRGTPLRKAVHEPHDVLCELLFERHSAPSAAQLARLLGTVHTHQLSPEAQSSGNAWFAFVVYEVFKKGFVCSETRQRRFTRRATWSDIAAVNSPSELPPALLKEYEASCTKN